MKFHWKLLVKGPMNAKPDTALTPNMRQAVIWTNAGMIYWRICASFGLDKLTYLGPSEIVDILQT